MKWRKKKWALAVYCTLVGTGIAIVTGADLREWTTFALAMIAAFGASDVADKRLNGGSYDTKE